MWSERNIAQLIEYVQLWLGTCFSRICTLIDSLCIHAISYDIAYELFVYMGV